MTATTKTQSTTNAAAKETTVNTQNTPTEQAELDAQLHADIAAANERAAKVAPQGGEVTKEQIQAGWEHLSDSERDGFRRLGWAPVAQQRLDDRKAARKAAVETDVPALTDEQKRELDRAKLAKQGRDEAAAKKSDPKPAKSKPKGKWYEVGQPDVELDAKGDFVAYLIDTIEDGVTVLRPLGGFPASAQGTRPAEAVRLAISKLDGYDQARAEQAEFLTVRTRYVRRTLAITGATEGAAA